MQMGQRQQGGACSLCNSNARPVPPADQRQGKALADPIPAPNSLNPVCFPLIWHGYRCMQQTQTAYNLFIRFHGSFLKASHDPPSGKQLLKDAAATNGCFFAKKIRGGQKEWQSTHKDSLFTGTGQGCMGTTEKVTRINRAPPSLHLM